MVITKHLRLSDGTPPKVERTLFKEQVVDILRSQIVLGHLPPGTPLIERAIAESLQVSRLPVREALQVLEQEGLVSCLANHRRCVIQLTERDIHERYEVRLHLERLAVERAAHNTTPHHQQELNTVMEVMEQAFRSRDTAAFPLTDVALHHTIWKQADNLHLIQSLQMMSGQLLMFTSRHTQIFDWDVAVGLHRALVHAINSGDTEQARRSIDAHMQSSLERTLTVFSAQTAA